jgi:hypothetical protein
MFLAALGVSFAPSQVRTDLSPGEGRDSVAVVCTACHTADIVVSARMSRASWDTTITWMQETQGLGPLEPDVRNTILDYLEKTQGPLADDEERVLGAGSPWAHPLYRPNPIWR